MPPPPVPKDPGISQDMVSTLRAIAAFQRGADVPGAVVVDPAAERSRNVSGASHSTQRAANRRPPA